MATGHSRDATSRKRDWRTTPGTKNGVCRPRFVITPLADVAHGLPVTVCVITTQSPPDVSRILVADDQTDVLEALRILLCQHGFALDLVTSPRAVIANLRDHAYDLLLVDLNYSRDTTSGEEGLALLTEIRRQDALLPVVVMTGWGNIELAVDAMRRGATSFVQKPWDNVTLVQILQRDVADARDARQREDVRHREQQDALAIQRALLPASLPSSARFQMTASWQPAAGIGGDCYDAFTFGSDVIGLTIADVAGKGLPAALLMSSLQAAVRAFARDVAPVDAVCASVNRLLCGRMVPGRFATFCYVRLDGRANTLAYANAGHNPPLLVRANGEVTCLSVGGTVLGVFPEAVYRDEELALTRGDRLVLYTDGITEACSSAEEEFGATRLIESVREYRTLDAVSLHERVLSEVTAFSGGLFQDDATLIVVAVE
ncbi:MAG: PP2C family protein-serine/threonine phosphatase [Vicinamibacterales bacterium]